MLENLKKELKNLGVNYSQYQLFELVNSIKIALEDGSEFIFVTNGYKDIELNLSFLK